MVDGEAALLKDERTPLARDNDLLGQGPALDTLKDAIGRLPTPACLALYGSWGSGKTTLMASARAELKDDGHPTVWFDPWQYERHDNVLLMLLLQIVRGLELQNAANVRRFVEQATKVALQITGKIGSSAAGLIGGPLVKEGLGLLGSLDLSKLATQLAAGKDPPDDIRKLRQRFAGIVRSGVKKKSGKRLVVFLDDLDRCLPDQAVALIEAVKLFLADGAADPIDPKNGGAPVVFVFGLDRLIIGEAIRARFPQSTLYTGENYLEKIFDLSLEAPPIESNASAVRKFIDSLPGLSLDDLARKLFFPVGSQEDASSVADEIAAVLAQPVLANPRVVKRSINRLRLLAQHGRKALPSLSNDTALLDDKSATRLIAWIAGAERFRSFRQFYRDAGESELGVLDEAVRQASGVKSPQAIQPSGRIAAIVATPGFTTWYWEKGLLGLASNDAQANVRTLLGKSKAPFSTLQGLEDLLRRVGL